MSVERKPGPSGSDDLTVKLHVQSLALENLVSPFESDMLELKSPGAQPINPTAAFRTPIPSGSSLDQTITFQIPAATSLEHTTLQITTTCTEEKSR